VRRRAQSTARTHTSWPLSTLLFSMLILRGFSNILQKTASPTRWPLRSAVPYPSLHSYTLPCTFGSRDNGWQPLSEHLDLVETGSAGASLKPWMMDLALASFFLQPRGYLCYLCELETNSKHIYSVVRM